MTAVKIVQAFFLSQAFKLAWRSFQHAVGRRLISRDKL